MAIARVVMFEGVDSARMAQMKERMEQGERPAEMPATEMIMLHDAAAEKAVAILFFDTEDDYQRADAFLSAMPADETPGSRTAVNRYDVAIRMTG